MSYGTENDVFIVDAIKDEPSEAMKQGSQPGNSADVENQDDFDEFENYADGDNDDDDFTWQQDENDDFIFGLNNTQTVRKETKSGEAETEDEGVQIKTEPEVNIKEEEDVDENEYFEVVDEDEDEEYEEEYEKPKRRVRKKRSDSETKKEKRPKRDPANRPFAIKKDPEEIEEAKKRKLTGKKACKYCATLFKTQQEVDRHKCEYLKCKPDHFICRICYKELSRNTFSNHMGYVHGDPRLQCDICSKQFKDNRKLMYHISTHTGDRPFKCEVADCKASFISKYGLMRHMGKIFHFFPLFSPF